MKNSTILLVLTAFSVSAYGDNQQQTTVTDLQKQMISTVEELLVLGAPGAGNSSNEKVIAPVVETPISITQFDQTRIEKQNLANVSDILKYVAGGRDKNGVWEHSDGYSIRGFDQSSYIVWDGMLRNDTSWWAASEPFLLESIEVLKGPSSVMYGQTAPGGVAVQKSKRAQSDMSNEVELQLGSYNEKVVNLDIGTELNQEGTLIGRLVTSYTTEDDQINYVEFERRAVLPTVFWKINDKTDITFITLWQQDIDDNNDGIPSIGTIKKNPNGKIPLQNYTGEPELQDGYTTTQYSFGYELNHAINDSVDFKQNFRHFRVRVISENYIGQDGFKNMNPPLADGEEDLHDPLYDYRTVNRYMGSYFYNVNNWQIDNNIIGQFSHGKLDHTLMTGVEYSQLGQQYSGSYGELSSLDIFNPIYGNYTIGELYPWNGQYSTDQTAFYIQDHIKIDQQFIVNASLRFDSATSTDKGEWVEGGEAESKDNAVTGRLGFMYLAENGLSPYVSYAESFLPIVGKTVEGNAFVPEEGIQYETGIKFGDKSDPLQLTFSVFDITRKNILTRHPTIDGAQVQNGSQQHKGVELESTFNFLDRLSATLTLAHLKAEITESYDEGVKGNSPEEVPENTASIWLDYQTLFNPLLSFTFGITYESSTYGDQQNTLTQPGHQLFEAGVHYEREDWRLSLTGSNLTDEKYFSSCWSGNYCARGEPRLISGSASYTW